MTTSILVRYACVTAVIAFGLVLPGVTVAERAGTSPHPQKVEVKASPAPHPQAPQGLPQRKASLTPKDDPSYQQSTRLLAAVSKILNRTAEQRAHLDALPSRDSYYITPPWRETREDRNQTIRQLLDAALAIVADAPVVELQDKLGEYRRSIAALRDQIASLREKRLQAPAESPLPGMISDTQRSIDAAIADLETRIKSNEDAITGAKKEINAALQKAGVQISETQLDLLLDSVLGGDLVRLVTAFQAARAIDDRLGELLAQASDDITTARRYFAMHAALFAMVVHAQDVLIEKIDAVYIEKLRTILEDIGRTRENTRRLLMAQNRPDQQRALEANARSQELAEKVARYYRDYLSAQRKQLAEARGRTQHDLEIADNTFETVEASFQLQALMENARTSFEALKRLEAPGFDHVFKNDALRREFDNLTQKLRPTS